MGSRKVYLKESSIRTLNISDTQWILLEWRNKTWVSELTQVRLRVSSIPALRNFPIPVDFTLQFQFMPESTVIELRATLQKRLRNRHHISTSNTRFLIPLPRPPWIKIYAISISKHVVLKCLWPPRYRRGHDSYQPSYEHIKSSYIFKRPYHLQFKIIFIPMQVSSMFNLTFKLNYCLLRRLHISCGINTC